MKRSVVRENEWNSLRECAPEVEDHGAWADACLRTSERIQRELGLRLPPIELGARSSHDTTFRCVNVAGLLSLPKLVLQVVPKFISSTSSTERWQASILSMLSRVRKKHFSTSKVHGLRRQRANFIDHLAHAFVDSLDAALRGEVMHTYRHREDRSSFLRGRLLLERQVQRTFSHPHELLCEVDFRDSANDYNQLLHWASCRLLSLTTDPHVRRRLLATNEKLPIHGKPSLPARIPSAPPPQYREYAEPLDIAAQLARGWNHGQMAGDLVGYGYLLDMERLFERFVEKSLVVAASAIDSPHFTVQAQDTIVYARPLNHSGRSYYTRPDNVLYSSGSPLVIVDAKYKMMSDAEFGTLRKPQNGDVYQLVAAMVAHKCTRGLLLYPKINADSELGDGNLRLWQVETNGVLFNLGAAALDLTSLESTHSLKRMDEALKNLILRVYTS